MLSLVTLRDVSAGWTSGRPSRCTRSTRQMSAADQRASSHCSSHWRTAARSTSVSPRWSTRCSRAGCGWWAATHRWSASVVSSSSQGRRPTSPRSAWPHAGRGEVVCLILARRRQAPHRPRSVRRVGRGRRQRPSRPRRARYQRPQTRRSAAGTDARCHMLHMAPSGSHCPRSTG